MIILNEAVQREATEKLFSAVIADILDEKGVLNFSMDHGMRQIIDRPVFGRALTLLASDLYEQPDELYKMEIEAIDMVQPGDVLVAKICGTEYNGFFGELLGTATLYKGGCGAIIDGYIRDTRQLRDMGFPICARGHSPLDSKGRCDVIAVNVPVKCGGVLVQPGDYVFGDEDGIVVIPNALVSEVIDDALEKVSSENNVRKDIMQGVSMKDVFQKYGIL